MSVAAVAEQAPVRYFGRIFVDEFEGLRANEIAVLVALRSFGREVRASHRTIADRAGMSVTTLQRTLKSLGAKGRIIWAGAVGAVNRYLVRDAPTSVDTTDGSVVVTEGDRSYRPRGSVISTDKSESPKKRVELEDPEIFPAPAARVEEERMIGRLPDDGAQPHRVSQEDLDREAEAQVEQQRREKKPPVRGTAPWNAWYFAQESRRAGHATYSKVVLNTHLKRLKAEHGYSYEEIAILLETFFIRHDIEVRSFVGDLALKLISTTPLLMKEAEGSIRNLRRGYVPSGPIDWSTRGL